MMQKDKLLIGNFIKLHRLNSGLSQGEIADKLGMDSSNYSKIERNIIYPSIILLKELCIILNIDANKLLGITK